MSTISKIIGKFGTIRQVVCRMWYVLVNVMQYIVSFTEKQLNSKQYILFSVSLDGYSVSK